MFQDKAIDQESVTAGCSTDDLLVVNHSLPEQLQRFSRVEYLVHVHTVFVLVGFLTPRLIDYGYVCLNIESFCRKNSCTI